ncbi:MAG TPA: class I SAM-dependent methyltransferase [Polyangiaceae bacterium]|nr:class I SAM-dependent methyltransferase [Polyangiaceae bacterium]
MTQAANTANVPDTGNTNGAGSSGIFQLFRERLARDAMYGVASYWDARASARHGMARSLWPSNAFNTLWDERQRAIVARALGDVRGHRIADVGCGTGRMTRWLAEEQGARHVVGLDFSQATVDAARAESAALVSSGLVRFEQADVLAGLGSVGAVGFDEALVLGCLSVACSDRRALERAVFNVAKLVRRGGRVLILEPIHRSPLLRRVLDLGIEEWVAAANRAGLDLVSADRMGFVPVRLVFSVRDLPQALVGPIFRAGEQALDTLPWLYPLSDYKLLLFTRSSRTVDEASL